MGISDALYKDAQRQEDMIKSMAGAVGMPRSLFVDPFNYVEQFGYREKPTAVTYDTMRQMADRNQIVAAVIQTRINQIAAFANPQKDQYSLGFRIVPVDPNRKVVGSVKKEVQHLEQYILNTGATKNPRKDNFEEYLRKTTRDSLTFDQVNTEIVPDFHGNPAEFYAVDAGTIRRAEYDDPDEKVRAYTENRIIDYVQVLNGVVVNEYAFEEMVFATRNPRSHILSSGYGTSELEILVNTVTSHLWAEEFNRRFFSNSSTPKGILHIKGNIAPDQLEAFKKQWQAQISGVSNAWKTPVVNSEEDMNFIHFQQNTRDMEFINWMEYLVKIVSAIYQIDPAEINFDMRSGTAQAPAFESTNESKERMSKDKGLKPLLRFTENYINRHILDRVNPEYKIMLVGMDAKTPEQHLDMKIKEGQNFKTINEIRNDMLLDDLDTPEGDMILNPIVAQVRLAEQQAQMMQAQGGEEEIEETLPASEENLIQSLKKDDDYTDLEL